MPDYIYPNYTDPGKPNKGVFIASNCWTTNARIDFINDISKHYHIDTHGGCFDGKISKNKVDALLTTSYKYYFAFENSNCEDYITEKIFTAFR